MIILEDFNGSRSVFIEVSRWFMTGGAEFPLSGEATGAMSISALICSVLRDGSLTVSF
jgi:hypothetical protein